MQALQPTLQEPGRNMRCHYTTAQRAAAKKPLESCTFQWFSSLAIFRSWILAFCWCDHAQSLNINLGAPQPSYGCDMFLLLFQTDWWWREFRTRSTWNPPTPIMNSCELLRICFASLPTWWMTWAQHANPGALEVKFHGCFFAFCPCPLLQHQLNSIIRHHHDKGHLHPPSCTVNALSQRLKTRNKIALGRAGFLVQCALQKPRNIFHLGVKMMTWCLPRISLKSLPTADAKVWLIGFFCQLRLLHQCSSSIGHPQ